MVIFDKYKVQFVISDQTPNFWVSGNQVFCHVYPGSNISLGTFNSKQEAQLELINIGQAIARGVGLYLVADPEVKPNV